MNIKQTSLQWITLSVSINNLYIYDVSHGPTLIVHLSNMHLLIAFVCLSNVYPFLMKPGIYSTGKVKNKRKFSYGSWEKAVYRLEAYKLPTIPYRVECIHAVQP